MKKQKIKEFLSKLANPGLIIGIAMIARLVPHIPNFTPIGAMALFGGAHLNRRYALIAPIAALFLSDLFIGFYSPIVMVSVYGSFVLVGLIGIWLRKRKNPRNVLFAALISALLFFFITNFAVWLSGFYSRGPEGLLTSYTMALPFFRGTLFGDLFYTAVFFGGYELVLRLVKKPALATVNK